MLLGLASSTLFAQQGQAQTQGVAPASEPGRSQIVFRALQEAFPDRVGEMAFVDGDWTLMVAGRRFFWADGRLLPEAYRHLESYYGPHSFYTIPERPASPSTFSPQLVERLRERGSSEVRQARRDVHRSFQAALYGGNTRIEVEAQQRRVRFLGFQITVHRDLVEPLEQVEREIRAWHGGEAFIATLGSAAGYSWRQIADTQRMSFHSWGLAVDILPRARNRPIYWLWERNRPDDNWMLIPLEARWNPPDEVVDAFKRNGFIWGGNWVYFDNMHFEFRPELIAYTRILESLSAGSAVGFGRSLHHVYPDFLPN